MADRSANGGDDGGLGRPVGRLALAFQEAFTVTVRLRTGRQVASDAESFRRHIKNLIAAADREARDAGYDREHVRLAVYAFIAFLDESVLNSRQAMVAAWPRKPLQEEVFGDHRAGETFFEHLRDLLGRRDSHALADTLEVFQLCMLLGFRGRFGSADSADVHALVSRTREKMLRIRGAPGELSPRWAPPEDEAVPRLHDPWVRRLALGAGTAFALAVALLVIGTMVLGGEAETLRTAAGAAG